MDAIWRQIEQNINAKPGPIQELNVIYQFELSGENGGVWQLSLTNGQAMVEKHPQKEPDCKLMMSIESFKKLVSGKLNGATAFMTGKLKVQGSLGLALKMENLLRQYELGPIV